MSGATKLRDLQAGTSEVMDSSAMETEEYYNEEGGEWSQKVDTGQLCRVCASPNEYLIPIFDGEGLEHELAMKIHKHLPIKVTETDTLPLHICYQCASTLIAWHDLVISCVEADKKLRELQVEDEDDDDEDKGAEMFESHSMDSDPVDEVDQPSTSEAQSQVTKSPAVKKTTPNKEKKPKLKMVLVKGPPAGTSGQKTGAKIQVAKVLEQAKSKEGGNEESASERYFEHNPRTNEGSEDSSPVLGTSYKKYSKGRKLAAGHVSDAAYNCKICEEHFYTQEQFSDHLSHHGIEFSDSVTNEILGNISKTGLEENAEWQCVRCDFENSDVGNIELLRNIRKTGEEENVRKEEGTGKWECVRCDIHEETQNSEQFKFETTKNHAIDETEMDIKPFQCKYCGVCFNSAAELFKHSTYHNNSSLLSCNFCSKTFEHDEELTAHLQIHISDKTFLCHFCGKTFKNKSALNQHAEIHGNKPIRTCEKCGKMFRSISNFRNHVVLHTGVKLFVCDKCGKSFYTSTSLNVHLHAHSDARPFKCCMCSRRFRWQKNLKVHERTHNREKGEKLGTEVVCSVCEKELLNKMSLKAHMRSHSIQKAGTHKKDKSLVKEGKLIPCSICDRQFRGKSSLDYHMKVRHGAEMYGKCDVCDKSFPSKQALENHIRIHTDERPYKCNKCNKAFRSLNSYHSHIKIHSDIRPYPCIICGKRFRKKSQLDCHVRIHTGEKPFVCQLCNHSFTQKWAMLKHVLTHKQRADVCQPTPLTSFKAFQEAKNALKIVNGQKDDTATQWFKSEENLEKCHHCSSALAVKTEISESHSLTDVKIEDMKFEDGPAVIGSFEADGTRVNDDNVSHILEKNCEVSKQRKRACKKKFPCKDCERVFTRKCDLKRHSKCHVQYKVEIDESEDMNASDNCTESDWAEADDPLEYETCLEEDGESKSSIIFECIECGKHFKLKDSYFRHMRIHTGEKPFTCHVCGKQFRDSGGLSRHLKDVHARIKNFTCDICGRSFASKATREDHRRIHTGERPFICDSCGKTFKSKASLYIHSKIHTDSFPHKCTHCEKCFRRRQELLAHVTTHTGEKPHACEECGRCFRVRGELLRHKLVHSEDKPYICTVCGLSFRQKRYLKNHEKTRHAIREINM